MLPPQLGNGLGVHQLEDALLPLGPLDVPGTRVLVLEQVQQELPQVGGAASWDTNTQVHLLCLFSWLMLLLDTKSVIMTKRWLLKYIYVGMATDTKDSKCVPPFPSLGFFLMPRSGDPLGMAAW